MFKIASAFLSFIPRCMELLIKLIKLSGIYFKLYILLYEYSKISMSRFESSLGAHNRRYVYVAAH